MKAIVFDPPGGPEVLRYGDAPDPRPGEGELQPVIDTILPLDQAAEAHRILEANRNAGKVVLRVVSD